MRWRVEEEKEGVENCVDYGIGFDGGGGMDGCCVGILEGNLVDKRE